MTQKILKMRPLIQRLPAERLYRGARCLPGTLLSGDLDITDRLVEAYNKVMRLRTRPTTRWPCC